MSCTLIFTAGAKGRSSKTMAGRFLITYLQEKGTSPLILDLDDENHTLSRFFPEAVQVGIQPEFAHDVLRNTGIIVADLKAGTGYEVLRWFLELPFSDLNVASSSPVSAPSPAHPCPVIPELGHRSQRSI
jgi:hypothetical protein